MIKHKFKRGDIVKIKSDGKDCPECKILYIEKEPGGGILKAGTYLAVQVPGEFSVCMYGEEDVKLVRKAKRGKRK